MTTIAPDEAAPVKRYWETPVAFLDIDPATLGEFDVLLEAGDSNQPLTALPVADHVTDPRSLREAFLEGMATLAARERAAGVAVVDPADVDLKLEIWRAGYELPMYSSAGSYVGWYFLAGEGGAYADSGTISILDPRAGAEMTAVPGMPWGRHLTIQPKAGFMAIVPGWLIATVLPLENSQISVVVTAESLPR